MWRGFFNRHFLLNRCSTWTDGRGGWSLSWERKASSSTVKVRLYSFYCDMSSISPSSFLFSNRYIQTGKAFPFGSGAHSDVRSDMDIWDTRVSTWCPGIPSEHLPHSGGCQGSESDWKHGAARSSQLPGSCRLCSSLQVKHPHWSRHSTKMRKKTKVLNWILENVAHIWAQKEFGSVCLQRNKKTCLVSTSWLRSQHGLFKTELTWLVVYKLEAVIS